MKTSKPMKGTEPIEEYRKRLFEEMVELKGNNLGTHMTYSLLVKTFKTRDDLSEVLNFFRLDRSDIEGLPLITDFKL